jgi:hypothetical protein
MNLKATRDYLETLDFTGKACRETQNENIYVAKGYKNRRDYLEQLAGEYGVSAGMVFSLAEILGKSEDFDGLVISLEDGDFAF